MYFDIFKNLICSLMKMEVEYNNKIPIYVWKIPKLSLALSQLKAVCLMLILKRGGHIHCCWKTVKDKNKII